MQLIKSDVHITKEQRKTIFEQDKKLYNKKQKEMRRITFADRNKWRERNEEEARKIAEEWKGDMREKVEAAEGEEAMDAAKAEADQSKTSAATLNACASSADAIDDEFGDEFCDVDAVKDDISGFGEGDGSVGLNRDRRRTPPPIEDLF